MKVKVDPSSHVVPIILRILSVLETGSMPKVLANKWSKFHSLSIAVKELLKIQYDTLKVSIYRHSIISRYDKLIPGFKTVDQKEF